MKMRFVITGTDTGVGKTIFSAALVDALKAHYWKPIQSGIEEETDSEKVMRFGRVPKERVIAECYKLKTPVSPHHAAKLDGINIDPEKLLLPKVTSPLVIEGAGGLLVPLTENVVFADVFSHWQLPVILCARTALGTINHTLLSIEAMERRAIPIYGIVFIGAEEIATERIIGKFAKERILGRLPYLQPLTPNHLRSAFRKQFPLSIFEA